MVSKFFLGAGAVISGLLTFVAAVFPTQVTEFIDSILVSLGAPPSKASYYFVVAVIIICLIIFGLACVYEVAKWGARKYGSGKKSEAFTSTTPRTTSGAATVSEAPPLTDFSGRFAEEMMKVEVRRKRVSELEGHLVKHYDEVIHAMQFWFEDNFPASNPFSGPKVSYFVFPKGFPALGSIHWYSPPLRIETQDLETRTYVQDSVAQVRSHLLGENWERWQKLCDKVNGHLGKVQALWEEIEQDVRTETKAIGLTEWDGTLALGKPLDYYWIHILFVNVWLDPEYFAQRGTHTWDEEKPSQGQDSYKNNASVWWLFSGQVQSSDKAALEKLKPWLTIESDKITPTKTALSVELASIQADFNQLHQGWRRLENDYRGGLMRRLPQSCSGCRPLLDELAGLGA